MNTLFLFGSALLLCTTATVWAHGGHDDGFTGVKCGFSDLADKARRGVYIQSVRPDGLPLTHLSPSGRFLLHYTTTGPDAVPTADNNSNGVPDFVDSAAVYFDISYDVEVVEMGYQSPPSDGALGGGPEYDVYINDIGQNEGLYGKTVWDNTRVGDGGEIGRFTTYIIIDNNFSASDRRNNQRVFYETDLRALMVTAAHEFHHAVQIGGYGNSPNYSVFYEMSSTWMEYRVFPHVHDYRQYLPTLFGNLAASTFGGSSKGYDYGILGQFMHRRYGDPLLRSVWEGVRNRMDPFTALDAAYTARSVRFADEWCTLLPWFYHTGYRAEGQTYFHDAGEYPAAAFASTRVYSEPSVMLAGTLTPLELRFVRIVLPRTDDATADTVDIGLANTDIQAAALRQDFKPSQYSVVCSRQAGDVEIPGTPYSLSFENPDGYICFMPPVLNNGFMLASTGPFPNPCSPDSDGEVYFPVPANADVSTPVTLTVFDAAMLPVYTQTSAFLVVNRSRVIGWNCRLANGDRAGDGVYIFTTECNGKVTAGKVALISR